AWERGAGAARSTTRGASSAWTTLQQLLATDVWMRKTTGRWTGRGERSHARFFCSAAGTPGSEYRPPGERASAVVSAHITQTFPDERAQSRTGPYTRRRQALTPLRRLARQRTHRR